METSIEAQWHCQSASRDQGFPTALQLLCEEGNFWQTLALALAHSLLLRQGTLPLPLAALVEHCLSCGDIRRLAGLVSDPVSRSHFFRHSSGAQGHRGLGACQKHERTDVGWSCTTASVLSDHAGGPPMCGQDQGPLFGTRDD